jgi:hypothetical protein
MKKLIASCLFLLGGAIHASNTNNSTFRSAYADYDIALDTDPQSSFWQEAPPVYAEVDSYGHAVPLYRTRISSRWTKKNLYLLFVCPYEDLYLKPSPNVTEETYELWNWDVAELFISSDFHNWRVPSSLAHSVSILLDLEVG